MLSTEHSILPDRRIRDLRSNVSQNTWKRYHVELMIGRSTALMPESIKTNRKSQHQRRVSVERVTKRTAWALYLPPACCHRKSQYGCRGFYAAFRVNTSVLVTRAEAPWQEPMRQRCARQRSLSQKSKQRAFAYFFSVLEKETIGKSHPLVVVVNDAGRAVVRIRCRLAPLTRSYLECENRLCTNAIDEFQTTFAHDEQQYALKQLEKRCVKQGQSLALTHKNNLTECHLVRHTHVNALLRWNSIGTQAHEHFPHRDLKAARDIRSCLVLCGASTSIAWSEASREAFRIRCKHFAPIRNTSEQAINDQDSNHWTLAWNQALLPIHRR